MSLSDLQRGQLATIVGIAEEKLRVQLMRFGITQGSEIHCYAKLPLGPVVLRFAGQEIALGREIARQIQVRC